MLTEKQAEILPLIYDAALSDTAWIKALDSIAQVSEARGSVLFAIDQSGLPFSLTQFNSHYSQEDVASYFNGFGSYDEEAFGALLRHSARSFMLDLEIWPDMDRTPGRTDVRWMLDRGLRRRCAAILNGKSGWIDTLALQFPADYDSVRPGLLSQADHLLPHVAKAVEINRTFAVLRRQHDIVLDALNYVTVGVCIAAMRGNIIVANREARRLFDLTDGLTLGRDMRLVCGDPDETRQIGRAIVEAVETAMGRGDAAEAFLTVRRRSGAAPFLVEVLPLVDTSGAMTTEASSAIIFIIDPDRPRLFKEQAIGTVFGLSEIETEICRSIVAGLTNQEIADLRGVSPETVRTQVKSILRKCDARGRADLIRKTLSVSMPLEAP